MQVLFTPFSFCNRFSRIIFIHLFNLNDYRTWIGLVENQIQTHQVTVSRQTWKICWQRMNKKGDIGVITRYKWVYYHGNKRHSWKFLSHWTFHHFPLFFNSWLEEGGVRWSRCYCHFLQCKVTTSLLYPLHYWNNNNANFFRANPTNNLQ